MSTMTYQVTVSDIKCRGSGVKYNISSTGQISSVRDQVSSTTCQVLVSDITCQRSGVKYNMSSVGVRYHVKYNMSSVGVRYHVSEIECQV